MNPYVFVCSECHSDQRIDPMKNSWVQNNVVPPCRYCGGVCIYVEANTQEELAIARKNALRQSDNGRGL